MMALDAGDPDCTKGLSGRIFTHWTKDPRAGFVSPLTDAAEAMIKAQCYAIALAVVEEIQANATVTVSAGGLQRDHTNGNPATLAPAQAVTLPIT